MAGKGKRCTGFKGCEGILKAFEELKYNSEIDRLKETHIFNYYVESFRLFNNYLTCYTLSSMTYQIQSLKNCCKKHLKIKNIEAKQTEVNAQFAKSLL